MSESSPSHTLSTRLDTIARACLFAAVGSMPLLFLPVSGTPFFLFKITVFVLLLLVAALLHAVAEVKRGEVRLPRSLFLLACLALPLVYATSAFFSQNQKQSWFGAGTETDSVFFVTTCFLAAFLAVALLVRRAHIKTLLLVVCGSIILSAVFQYGVLLLGAATAFKALAPTDTLIGRWNEFSVLLGLLVVCAVAMLQFAPLEKRTRIGLAAATLATVPLLLLVNFSVVWAALFLAALAAFIAPFVGTRGPLRAPPLMLAALAVAAGLSFFFAEGLSLRAGPSLGIASIEARPSLQSTVSIAKATYDGKPTAALFGSGPNTFSEQWLLHRPSEVVHSPFWNIDFGSGFGTIPTALVSTGILGGAAWLLLFASLAYVVVACFKRESGNILGFVFSLGALFLYFVSFAYPLGQTTLLLLFICAGAAVAALRMREEQVMLSLRDVRGKVLGAGALALVSLISIATGLAVARAAVGETFHQLASRAESTQSAQGHVERALAVQRTDRNLRLATSIGVAELRAIAQGGATQKAQAHFESVLRPTLDAALEAVRYDPRTYVNWMILGQTYDFLARLGISGAYENARGSYEEAIKRNPTNPALHLSLAQLEGSRGNYSTAREHIDDALGLKTNYTEAILFVVQMEYARGNMPATITAARAAIATQPQNPTMWFELGLLLHTSGDAKGAIEALRTTLVLVPEYANAKYFLALALQKEGKVQEAIVLLEELRRTNPDNAELPFLISNLRFGKDPFAGSPLADPLRRSAAPFSE